MPESLRPHGLLLAKFLRSGDSPGKDAGVGCHFLLQGIFQTQGLNLGLLHCRQTLYPLSHQGSPKYSDPKESPKYWVGQKVHSGFSIRCYRKTQTKLFLGIYRGFPGDSDSKESVCNAGDPGSVPGSQRSPGEGNTLQYSYLENSMDRGVWQAAIHGVAKSRTRLSD